MSEPLRDTVPSDLSELGVLDAAALLRARAVSAVELLRAAGGADRDPNGGPPSELGEDEINAWVRLYPESGPMNRRATPTGGSLPSATPHRCCAACRWAEEPPSQ